MSDQPVGHSFRESHSHFPPGVSLKLILPKSTDTEVFRDAKNFMREKFEIGLVEDMQLVLAMNEKIAAFGLPTLDGRPDYSRGLVGDSESFRGWCHDLFPITGRDPSKSILKNSLIPKTSRLFSNPEQTYGCIYSK